MSVIPSGWVIADMKPTNLPEDVQAAFTQVTSTLNGVKYVPVLYCGHQTVQGTNHMIICEQTLDVREASKHLVKMVIRCIQQDISIVEMEQIF